MVLMTSKRNPASEHDVTEFVLGNRITKEQAIRHEIGNLLWVWQEVSSHTGVEARYWPTPQKLGGWLKRYGFEVCREGIIRGLRGFIKMQGCGPRNMEEAVYMLNYIGKSMWSLVYEEKIGLKKFVRKGPEKFYLDCVTTEAV